MDRFVIQVRLSGIADISALETRWRALEARAEASFFQTWTWTGCLAAERFPDPVLAEATEDGETVGLALFNPPRPSTGWRSSITDLWHCGRISPPPFCALWPLGTTRS